MTPAERKRKEREKLREAGRVSVFHFHTFPDCLPKIRAYAERITKQEAKRRGTETPPDPET